MRCVQIVGLWLECTAWFRFLGLAHPFYSTKLFIVWQHSVKPLYVWWHSCPSRWWRCCNGTHQLNHMMTVMRMIMTLLKVTSSERSLAWLKVMSPSAGGSVCPRGAKWCRNGDAMNVSNRGLAWDHKRRYSTDQTLINYSGPWLFSLATQSPLSL